MRAGEMDRRLELLAPIQGRGEAGEQIETFVPVATVWAKRVSLGSRSASAAGAEFTAADAVYAIRWHAAVRVGWRVREGDDVLEITSTSEIRRRESMQLACIARTDSAPIGSVES
jgi:SPP1 family predicted phage head-tail adaptor